MILTAMRPVNARLGRPSVNAPNPRYLLAGDKVHVISRVLGDTVNLNSEWILTEENEYFSIEGFHATENLKKVIHFADNDRVPSLFKELNISRLWDEFESKGEGVNVGVIDNGVACHPSLQNKVIELNRKITPPFDLNSHGTNMACIIAGLDETSGIFGISPMVKSIYSYYIDINPGKCHLDSDELIEALDAMQENNVHIINMSFVCQNASLFPTNESGIKVQEKINYLVSKGHILVSSTGNHHKRNPNECFPAAYTNVISVTGYNEKTNSLNVKSNFWEGVTIAMSVKKYFNNLPLTHSMGTSSAAAIISGFLACVYNRLPDPKTSYIKEIFRSFPLLKDSDSSISIPKFDSISFIQRINSES